MDCSRHQPGTDFGADREAHFPDMPRHRAHLEGKAAVEHDPGQHAGVSQNDDARSEHGAGAVRMTRGVEVDILGPDAEPDRACAAVGNVRRGDIDQLVGDRDRQHLAGPPGDTARKDVLDADAGGDERGRPAAGRCRRLAPTAPAPPGAGR